MNNRTVEYNLRSIKLPYLSGPGLRIVTRLLESPLRKLLAPSLLQSAGIRAFRKTRHTGQPTLAPLYPENRQAAADSRIPEKELPKPSDRAPGFRFDSIRDYAQAYRDGLTTPLEVAERLLQSIEKDAEREKPLNPVIALNRDAFLKEASESTERHRSGKPLSLLDGVPVGVKDELDMAGYPTTVGTTFLGRRPADTDAEAVARFRRLGVLLPGKLNMHEIGIGVTGFNPHYGPTRNPYNPDCYTGGSSSGSATAVASGLCPLAVGADGGGSIRIPSSFCGVFGIKPTYGRVSEHGAADLGWSVAHIGPIASSADDLILGYRVLAGPDPKDRNSTLQKEPDLKDVGKKDLKGVRLGFYSEWFQHADEEVVRICRNVVDQWCSRGAEVIRIAIPELEEARAAQLITIAGEMTRALEDEYDAHHREFGMDVRINLALARLFTARDYIHAQQVRTGLIDSFRSIFADVDAVVTPSTGLPAPVIPASALPDGDSDLSTLTEIMRFATPANLAGLPAVSCPAGYTADGRPVGIQAIARPWEESLLLRLARITEGFVERRKPEVLYSPLGGKGT